jgi:trimethylamine-N-oxide reductase (cytochrome c)
MHGEGKNVAPAHGCPNRLLSLMGGYTLQMRNPDSWEGWFWGAKYVWGCEPVGQMAPQANLFPDIAKHSELLLFWAATRRPPLRFRPVHAGQPLLLAQGDRLKSVFISPDLNYGAAVHADKWIPSAEHGRGAAACRRLRLDHRGPL